MTTNDDRPRFSSVLARLGVELGKLPAERQAEYRARFEAEAKDATDGKRILDPTVFLGTTATGQEVAKAFREEYMARGDRGHGEAWAIEHGAQAFRNFVPAFA